jgi:hypothetical protein
MILWIKTHLLTLPLMYLSSIPRTILTRILNEAIANAKGIGLVIESMTTPMSDGDRLRMVDEAGAKIDKNFTDLQTFYQRALLLSMNRARDLNDLAATKALWGLQ